MKNPQESLEDDWRRAASTAAEALDGGPAATFRALAELDRRDIEWPANASVHILRNFTVEPLHNYLRVAGYRRGIRIACDVAGYDTAGLDVHDTASALRRSDLDVVVLAMWLDELREAFDGGHRLNVEAAGRHLEGLVDAIIDVTDATVIVNTFPEPLASLGAVDNGEVEALNERIRNFARGNGRLAITDLPALVSDIGLSNAVDARFLLSSRAPLRPMLHRAWAVDIAQVVASVTGRAKKVVALDCDNTLWGGIVGEDGIDGIALDPNDYPGRVYYEFQRQLLGLRDKGVLLTICSRNNEADVFKVFTDHPHCLVRPDSCAGWRVNWNDKVANLEALAADLNLGLDSFTFIDDSPTECARVRRALPMVDVLEVPREPTQLLQVLARYDGWSRLRATSEDLARTQRYRAERERRLSTANFESLDEFLKSLDLTAELTSLGPCSEADLVGRIAQLSQRTNQFTATTRRYGDGDIDRLRRQEDAMVLALRVEDRFGDYGISGAAILTREGDEATIDSFFLSCRILGRGLERTFLALALKAATDRWPVRSIRVEYLATSRNGQVNDFFRDSGLRLTSADERASTYVADSSWKCEPAPHIRVTQTAQTDAS